MSIKSPVCSNSREAYVRLYLQRFTILHVFVSLIDVVLSMNNIFYVL